MTMKKKEFDSSDLITDEILNILGFIEMYDDKFNFFALRVPHDDKDYDFSIMNKNGRYFYENVLMVGKDNFADIYYKHDHNWREIKTVGDLLIKFTEETGNNLPQITSLVQ